MPHALRHRNSRECYVSRDSRPESIPAIEWLRTNRIACGLGLGILVLALWLWMSN
jgi:hypothetical protein